ncbi:MAG: DNA polymerase I, partial [Syntrophorhabdaceae bacterium]|nr:DNA polymerase I [Syntrophorhabdaceae bacterium]
MNEELKIGNRQSAIGNRKRVFLVDGNSYLYRAFYATPHLSNSKGMPTNAIYAFISMIKKLMNAENPDTFVIVFDSKAPSFREEISKAYKAQRPPMPDNLSIQIPYVKRIIGAMGIPILEMDGFEADDIIGTIVNGLKEHDDMETYIVTSDKDMMQLLSEKVFIYDSMKNQLISEKEAEEKFGVRPSLMIDYLALCGDTSDNIPGVPGIGDKTARELISGLGSIDAIYNNIEEVKKPSVRGKLLTGKDLAVMSKQLATIRLDVPVDVSLVNLENRGQDLQELRRIYRELEFTSLYREIKADGREKVEWKEAGLTQLNMRSIAIMAAFQGRTSGDLYLDGFAVFDGEGAFFSQNEKELYEIFSCAGEIATYNLKKLIIINLRKGKTAEGKGSGGAPPQFFDVMLATYLINPLRKDYALGSIIEEYLDADLTPREQKSMLIESACRLLELKDILLHTIEAQDLANLYYRIELPLIEVLADMEQTGVKVDRKILGELSRDFDTRLTGIVKEIYDHAGEPFNINSPQQLSRILFDTLHLTPVKKTKTGYSTDIEVLETLSLQHPLPKKILEYRTLTKLKNTYIDVLPTLINPHTGRIHTTFNQMVTATGRLSSSDPNLQNIPIRGEEGMKIRGAFVPEDGCILLSSDYSQIELRVLAHLSQDASLIDTFLNDGDIHTTVAGSVFMVKPENITFEMRRTAKVINFGIIYGMSAFGLSKELGISQREAQQFIDGYFERHKGVREYMDRTIGEARANGFVRTLFGRMRYIPEINNTDANIRGLGERAAMNTPIQGSAADIIKMAMINIHRKINERGLSSRLILQIHDELLFEVKEEETAGMETLVREEMERVVTLSVPLKVSIGKGDSWAAA